MEEGGEARKMLIEAGVRESEITIVDVKEKYEGESIK